MFFSVRYRKSARFPFISVLVKPKINACPIFFGTHDHGIDDVEKIIQIPSGWYTIRNSIFGGYDDSNEEAAEQLYENLSQNFGTWSGRVLRRLWI